VDDETAPLLEALLSYVSSEIAHNQPIGETFLFPLLIA